MEKISQTKNQERLCWLGFFLIGGNDFLGIFVGGFLGHIWILESMAKGEMDRETGCGAVIAVVVSWLLCVVVLCMKFVMLRRWGRFLSHTHWVWPPLSNQIWRYFSICFVDPYPLL